MILSFGSAAPVLAVPSAVALAGYIAAASLDERRAKALRAALIVGWLAQAFAIAADVSGVGGPMPGARFGFAPALSATLWLVLAVHAIESRFVPLPGVRRTLALLGALVVALAWWFPGEMWAHGGSPWEPLHWVLGIASYGLFGAAVLHAALLNRAERRLRLLHTPAAIGAEAMAGASVGGVPSGGVVVGAPHGVGDAPSGAIVGDAPSGAMGLPLLRLEKLTFRFVWAGFIALSATLVLGWWFANPWRWDHKTVFSILGWIVFAGLLAGRHAFGWRGRRATGWLYAGAALLLLAYVGSRFVLEVLLQRSSFA